MGLKIETWNIAFRTKQEKILDTAYPFQVLRNGIKGWYADPFLFDYQGNTYLFAEFFSYKLNRGIITCSKYDKQSGKFGKHEPIIVESFHLSYPVVFEYQGKIYMMPETSEADALFLYEAVLFPNHWHRTAAVMEEIKLLDTTPVILENKLYALTMRQNSTNPEQGELLLLEYDRNKFHVSKRGIISRDMSVLRPGGHFLSYHNKMYRVSQDCKDSYGRAINVMELSNDFQTHFKERLKYKVYPKDIVLDISEKPEGIHTYNVSENLEVIDVKFYRNSFYRVFCKIFNVLLKR